MKVNTVTEIKAGLHRYFVEDGKLVFIEGDTLYQYDLVSGTVTKRVTNMPIGLYLHKSIVGAVCIDSRILVVEGKSLPILFDSDKDYMNPHNLVLDKFVLFYNAGTGTGYEHCKARLFDLEKEEFCQWQSQSGHIVSCGDKLFRVFHGALEWLDVTTGEVRWRKELDQKEIPKLVACVDDIVIVGVGDWRTEAFQLGTDRCVWGSEVASSLLSFDNGKLFGSVSNYVSIDPKTGKRLTKFIDHEYFENIGIVSNRSNQVEMGQHMVTTDNDKGAIGLFNTQSLKFDAVKTFDDRVFRASSPICVWQNYLVIQDHRNIINVFEVDFEESA